MQLSEQGAADIRLHEGVVLHWYKDSGGTPTIGIGFTWGSLGFRRWWAANRPGKAFAKGATMTRQECEECLIMVMDGEYGPAVNRFLVGTVKQNVFDCACSVVYNCGIGALQWKWAAAMKNGDYAEAAALLKTTAITTHGRREPGLVDRRAAEARLLKTGQYASGGAPVPPDDTPQRAPKADPVEIPSKPTQPVIGAAVVAASLPVMTHWHDLLAWLWSVL